MNAPTPNKNTFPPSWRKWRKVKEGEILRATDRVVSRYTFTGPVRRILSSRRIWMAHAGETIRPAESDAYPFGWYYRKVS